MLADHVSLLGIQKHGSVPMQKRLAIVVAAVMTLALPQFALAHTSNGQSSAPMQDSKAFTHWESMGSAGPEPVQSIDRKKIPGVPNGRLAQMAESSHGQFTCRTPAAADFAGLPTCP
jgi:hypothetical protein